LLDKPDLKLAKRTTNLRASPSFELLERVMGISALVEHAVGSARGEGSTALTMTTQDCQKTLGSSALEGEWRATSGTRTIDKPSWLTHSVPSEPQTTLNPAARSWAAHSFKCTCDSIPRQADMDHLGWTPVVHCTANSSAVRCCRRRSDQYSKQAWSR